MGTIVYINLVELLLEEEDKTKEEIINESKNRFGFVNESLSYEIGIQLIIGEMTGHFQKLKNEKYHLLALNDSSIFGRKRFLKNLKETPHNYLKERPHINKLKQALEGRLKC